MTGPVVHIVDDDAAVRDSTAVLLRAAGHETCVHASGEEFLSQVDVRAPGCVVLDLRLPGADGLEVLHVLKRLGSELAVILLTGHGDVPQAVEALKAGASDFLEKPYDPDTLLAAVEKALGNARGSDLRIETAAASARARLATLTPRECQVLAGLVAGESNKAIAYDLSLSPRTVEMHRANMMARLGVNRLSEALRVAYDAGLMPERRAKGSGPQRGGRRADDPR
jgi:two-component system response regulator FixJ